MISSVRVIGAGLIGTSVGLSLRSAGISVEIIDIDLNSQKLSQDLVKSVPVAKPDLIVVAVPISVNLAVILEQLKLNPSSIVCDLSSVKSDLILKVKELSANHQNFISLHPMAGRELSGAIGARADLFLGRAWVVINDLSSEKSKAVAGELVKICGGTAYEMSSSEHDVIVGKISHLPQILSTALAAKMIDVDSERLNIAGQGLRDITRLAQADSKLWSQILIANGKIIRKDLNNLISDLVQLEENLEINNIDKIEKFLQAGNKGKAKIPGKHGEQARDYAYLAVVIDDKPGQLARIFNECADINVNIEDLSMEHSPGQETGLITLSLSEADYVKLSTHLEKVGFKVHSGKNR